MSRNEAAIAKRIVSVDEADPYVKILVYGRNGMGKTRFASTAANCLIVDIHEEGTRSAKGSGAKKFSVEKWADIGDIYWYLKAGNHPYEAVALDTLTAMNRLCLNMVMGEAEDRDPNREIGMPDRRSYGRAGELMRNQLLAFRNLPMHVIFTAQERVISDEDGDEPVLHTPDLPAGSRGIAMGSVGIIGRIYQQQVKIRNKKTKAITERWEVRMLVGPHDTFDTKDRTGALGNVLRNPTLAAIIEKW